MAEEIKDAGLPEDDFDLAFEAAASVGEESPDTDPPNDAGDDPPPADDKAGDDLPADDKAGDDPPADDKAGDDPPPDDPPADDNTGDDKAGDKKPGDDPPPDDKAPVSAAAAAVEAVEAIEKAKVEAKTKADAAAKSATDAQTLIDEATARETPSEEEQAVIAQMKADFPEVAKAFDIQQRVLLAKIENLFTTKLGEVSTQVEQRIAPTEAIVGTTARDAHEAAILGAHEDAFTLLPDMEDWIQRQPAFLHEPYNAVLDNGSSAEVITLIKVYKDAVGITSAGEDTAKKEAEEAVAKKEADEKEKKLNAQEGVRSRRTGKKTVVDPNDFDGAFDKYAEQA